VTAEDVKRALYGRHPASHPDGGMPGEWTCLEEWKGIDFMAFSAWRANLRIGYEVKVSRGDMRSELLRPDKRADAVSLCHLFYFAVPKGLLTSEERLWPEPKWQDGDFDRTLCPGIPPFGRLTYRAGRKIGRYGGLCFRYRGQRERLNTVEVPKPGVVVLPEWERDADRVSRYYFDEQLSERVTCPTCGGKGYVQRSRVERVAPTLWVPSDVGLLEVDGRGCRVVRKAPRRQPRSLSDREISDVVRWSSVRGDWRHRRARAA